MFAAKEIFVGNAELINLAPCYLSELLFIIVIPLFPYRTMMGRSIFLLQIFVRTIFNFADTNSLTYWLEKIYNKKVNEHSFRN
jgi:hypothetical protein